MITLSYSEFAADGGEFDDGSWERGVGERLCERAHVVSHLEFLALKNASTLICSTNLILRWMVKERERIFIGEYESASVAYQNISRSWACVLKRSSSTIRLFVFLYLVYSTRCSLFWFLFTLCFTFSTPHISHENRLLLRPAGIGLGGDSQTRMVATVWRHVELRTDSLTGRIYKPLHPFRWGVIFSTPSLAHSLRFLNLTDYNGIYSFGSDSSSALCSCFPPQCSASQSRSGKCFGPSLISLLHAIDLTHSILLVTFTTHLNHDNMFRDFW